MLEKIYFISSVFVCELQSTFERHPRWVNSRWVQCEFSACLKSRRLYFNV